MTVNYRCINSFLKELKAVRRSLTEQQYRTLKGQALSNNVPAARKGLDRITRRKADT